MPGVPLQAVVMLRPAGEDVTHLAERVDRLFVVGRDGGHRIDEVPGVDQQVPALLERRRAELGHRPGKAQRARPDAPDEVEAVDDPPAYDVEAGRGQPSARGPADRRRQRLGLGGLTETEQELDEPDAVGQRVVEAAEEDRPWAVGQSGDPGDDLHRPQRTAVDERVREAPADVGAQLVGVAGPREGGPQHVVGLVELRVVLPEPAAVLLHRETVEDREWSRPRRGVRGR